MLASPLAGSNAVAAEAAGPAVIELTQLPCQFLESEGGTDHGYRSTNIKDCEAINARTGAARVDHAKPLQLKAGRYIFRVTNRDVPYELGFWLRGDGISGRVTLPSVSGGGLLTGKTQDYAIDLRPGEYLYSCPLNTTPDYKLVVN
ncbi:MAG: hypothetical protein H6942_00315 [Candidatus Accumulibacter sp.]|nr:hypothetical protein [Paracoccaceae bacterium]MCP5246984.1 hypothetical protein [Accumulibacter sp.]